MEKSRDRSSFSFTLLMTDEELSAAAARCLQLARKLYQENESNGWKFKGTIKRSDAGVIASVFSKIIETHATIPCHRVSVSLHMSGETTTNWFWNNYPEFLSTMTPAPSEVRILKVLDDNTRLLYGIYKVLNIYILFTNSQ
jgi:hypothetical protein